MFHPRTLYILVLLLMITGPHAFAQAEPPPESQNRDDSTSRRSTLSVAASPTPTTAASGYQNFTASVYCRVYEVNQMADIPGWLEPRWRIIESHVKVGKIYLETHRDLIIASDQTLENLKRYFHDRGIETAGGITLTIDESNRFQTFCYTTDRDRQKVREIVEHTARHFDELILDDFFFTSCKCQSCITAKGERSWTAFRLDLLRAAARDLVIEPAKAINPKIKVVIKYPNWYEHFQGLGFDLERQPEWFDGIYTGTETRQPFYNAQHLQPYHGYSIVRYFENIAPGRNGGGWVDTGGMRDTDRYAEQLWLTLLAKAPEVTLFDIRQIQRPVREEHRGQWQDQTTTLSFESLVAPYRGADGTFSDELTVARVAGQAFDAIDPLLARLGTPVGVPSYRPAHAKGEDFLHSYLGMIGLPIDLRPSFPAEAPSILLTESASMDPELLDKIKRQLLDGKTVTITSGLARSLGDRLDEIVEVKVTPQPVLVNEFYRWGQVWPAERPILLTRVEYLTNDAWELIGAGRSGTPLLLQADYATGKLNILAVPSDPADFYAIPAEALNIVRQHVAGQQPVQLAGPAQVSLFLYDNNTCVVESFRDDAIEISLIIGGRDVRLRDLSSGDVLAGQPGESRRGGRGDEHVIFDTTIAPHSFRAFSIER